MTIEKILIVDDEAIVRNFLTETLKRRNYDIVACENGLKALQALKENAFDLVITDMRMPDLSGIDILRKTKELAPSAIVIVITAFGSIENAVEAMRLGAFNYLIKPFSPDTIEAVIEKAEEHLSLLSENAYLKQTHPERLSLQEVVCESAGMKRIWEEIKRVAPSNANVLLHGESGTGKEIIANAIHYNSKRAQKPFIKVNCAAIPETLIESEFFGHEKGAFTGAIGRRIGRFELAHGGTLLLDEITEVPLSLQPKLLRAIQEQEFERIGGIKQLKVDVRIISTTNRDLQQAVQEKVLREDLYYRLNVVPIHVPPLRERREDIIPLARFFVKKACIENHKEAKELTSNAEEALLAYRWPGNVRELSNIIERAIVLSNHQKIHPEELSLSSEKPFLSIPKGFEGAPRAAPIAAGSTLEELEKQYIIETLHANNMNRTKTAKSLGISLRTLRNKLHAWNFPHKNEE